MDRLKVLCGALLAFNAVQVFSVDESVKIGVDYPELIPGGISTSSGAIDINVNEWPIVQPPIETIAAKKKILTPPS